MDNEAQEMMKEAQQKVEEAMRMATAQAEEMARKFMADLLGGKIDPQQAASIFQGMVGRLPFSGGDSPYRVLGLDPSAPDDVVKLVYRHLARRHHPDRGGDAQVMAEINRAYEAICRERKWT
jgi:DnaJ-domain-containing protein 1